MTRARKTGLSTAAAMLAVWFCMTSPRLMLAQEAAQVERQAATVVAVVGGAELQRAAGGSWQLAVVGSTLFAGDRVRTRPTSRLKMVFQDDSLLDVGPATELVIRRQVLNAAAGESRSALELVTGKIRAQVGELYRGPKSRYEIETLTAVVAVVGSEFIVQYDTAGDSTDVVGIDGQVLVEGRLGLVGGGVQVGPQEAVRVQKGRFPSAPRDIDDTVFQQYIEGLDIIGTGGRDSLGAAHPTVRGKLAEPSDSLETVTTGARRPGGTRQGLVVGAPPEPVASRLSADVRTNTQPLIEYHVRPPGVRP